MSPSDRSAGKARRTHNRVGTLSAVLLGAGLIILGVSLWHLFTDSGTSPSSVSSGTEETVAPASVNFPAPALRLSSPEGRIETLADYAGKVVLLNNWAIWCPPCKAEMPTLQAYYKAHAAEGFTVIAIEAGSPPPEVSEFVEAFNLTFTVWIDPKSASLTAFRNGGLPSSYVIDRSGTTRLAWVGEISRAFLEHWVTPMLAEQG